MEIFHRLVKNQFGSSASPAMAEPTSGGAQATTFDPKTSPRTSSNAFFQETFIIFGHLTDQCVRCKFTEHFLQGPTSHHIPSQDPQLYWPMKKKLLLCALADFSEFAGPLVPPSLILYLLLAFAVFVPVPVPVCKCASVQVESQGVSRRGA